MAAELPMAGSTGYMDVRVASIKGLPARLAVQVQMRRVRAPAEGKVDLEVDRAAMNGYRDGSIARTSGPGSTSCSTNVAAAAKLSARHAYQSSMTSGNLRQGRRRARGTGRHGTAVSS